MKTLTLTALGITLFAIGFGQARSQEMDKHMGQADTMTTTQAMPHGDMESESGAMMKDKEMHRMKKEMHMNQATIPSDKELRSRLTPLQYQVTRQNGTEPPFNNAYWDNHAPGIYVDIISGKPLFSSTDKYDSGTGWPSFTRPLDPDQIVEKVDRSFFSVRTEIRSKDADAHLGHVFNDGPAPTGLRYCMNSAALRFIPVAELEQEGYGQFLHLFK